MALMLQSSVPMASDLVVRGLEDDKQDSRRAMSGCERRRGWTHEILPGPGPAGGSEATVFDMVNLWHCRWRWLD